MKTPITQCPTSKHLWLTARSVYPRLGQTPGPSEVGMSLDFLVQPGYHSLSFTGGRLAVAVYGTLPVHFTPFHTFHVCTQHIVGQLTYSNSSCCTCQQQPQLQQQRHTYSISEHSAPITGQQQLDSAQSHGQSAPHQSAPHLLSWT